MTPSIGTALSTAFYGRKAPTFVEPPGRRAVIVLSAVLLGAVLSLELVLRFEIGDLGTIAVAYVVIFALMHCLGYLAHLFSLAGESTGEEQ